MSGWILDLNGPWLMGGFQNGEGKEKGVFAPDYIPQGWLEVKIPGTVEYALREKGIIPLPGFSLNEKETYWLEECEWCFRKEFITEEPQGGLIVFDGLDLLADIYFNGRRIGSANNMHRPYRFAIKKELVKKQNVLALCFKPLKHNVPEYAYENKRDEERFAFRRCQMSFGWDISQRAFLTGPWRGVRFELGKVPAIINAAVYAEPDGELKSGPVKGHLWGSVAVRHLPPDAVLILRVEKNGKVLVERKLKDQTFDFKVENIRIWWPNGLGEPHTYLFKIMMVKNKTVLAEHRQPIAFKKVVLSQIREDRQRWSFRFIINGAPVFIKGANWVPPRTDLSRVAANDYEYLLELARRQGLQMIRIWGGGIMPADSFYEKCLLKGIMVWQDFLFACGYVPIKDKGFLDNITKEMVYQVKSLRHHQAIVLWCGDNECDSCEWAHLKEKVWDYPVNKVLSKKIVAEHDHSYRPYIPTSSYSPEHDQDPNSEYQGDRHNYSHGEDFRICGVSRDLGRFISECGHLGMPGIYKMSEIFKPMEKWPMDAEVYKYHCHPAALRSSTWEMRRTVPFYQKHIAVFKKTYFLDFIKNSAETSRDMSLAGYVLNAGQYYKLNILDPAISFRRVSGREIKSLPGTEIGLKENERSLLVVRRREKNGQNPWHEQYFEITLAKGNIWGKRITYWCDAAEGRAKCLSSSFSKLGANKFKSLEDFCEKAQILQAEADKRWLERFHRRWPECGGFLYWMLCDNSAIMSDAVIDSGFIPRKAYYTIRRLCQPVTVNFEYDKEKDGLGIYAINATLSQRKIPIKLYGGNFYNPPRLLKQYDVSLQGGKVKQIDMLSCSELKARGFAYLLLDASNEAVPENYHFFSELFHLKLPAAVLSASIKKKGENKIWLEVSADKFSYYTSVSFSGQMRAFDNKVRPIFFSDNDFHLHPGQRKVIVIEGLNDCGKEEAPEVPKLIIRSQNCKKPLTLILK